MAVIQISKIQLRRGLKGTGIPQLSSAELAWAIDTQELYIGNGSLAEGAPFVGNTKILTENDNILDLASSYRFGSSNPQITNSVSRSLQDKLDEIAVSVRDFGAVGNNSDDDAPAFKKAVDQLFKNAGSALKKVLIVPNGEYLFLTDLELPGTVILRGETKENAVVNIGSTVVSFAAENGQEISSSNRPSNVLIENLTIKRSTGTVDLTNLYDSDFNEVRFLSDYVLSNDTLDLLQETAAVNWFNYEFGTRVTDIRFNKCNFENQTMAVSAIQSDVFTTEVFFRNCTFENCYTGVVIFGVENQRNEWVFDTCHFKSIARQAINSLFGRGTVVQQSIFRNVGNGINTAETPITPMVEFGEYRGNEIINSSSDRLRLAEITNSTNKIPVPTVLNANKSEFTDMAFVDIDLTDSFKTLAVFNTSVRYIEIQYILRLGVGTRKGVLVIGVDNDLATASFSDNFTYSSSSSTTPGGIRMTEFAFNVALRDNDNDLVKETLVLSYRNPVEHTIDEETTISGEPGDITFSVCYGV